MSAMRTFDPIGRLDPGITLVEASAGTGKTYSIADIVVRLIAEEGLRTEQIAVVTFTRAATAELKERIRLRIAEALGVLYGSHSAAGHVVLEQLDAVADPAERAERARRLRDAHESFDACLISTIHGFCQRMLQQNAFESGADFELELTADTSELIEELVHDWITRELYDTDADGWAFRTKVCGFKRDDLVKIAEQVLRDPDMPVLPDDEPIDASVWFVLRDALARGWASGWATELPALIAAAKDAGVFRKRQQTYTAKKAAAKAEQITGWLATSPHYGTPLPDLDWWTDKLLSYVAEGEEPPQHDALALMGQLARFPRRLAAFERARFARWVVAEFDARNRARRTRSYQDLLRDLARRLGPDADPTARSALVKAVGARFRAALIDEFQDTDDLQWTIFRALFADEAHWLYLIGDPKQAIYRFRGANVHVYLEAKRAAGERVFTMRTNWRSDRRLVDGLNCLLDHDGVFGEPAIPYVPVDAPDRDVPDRLRLPASMSDAPLQLRFLDRGTVQADADEDAKPLNKSEADPLLPELVADEVVGLLDGGATLHDPGHARADADGFRPMTPADIAVLVRKGVQARAVHAALTEVGVPAVISTDESVIRTDESLEVLSWLEALDQPGRDGPARVAATTTLFGWNGSQLLALEDEDEAALAAWTDWLDQLSRWRATYHERGFLRTLRQAIDEAGVTARLLARPDGDRRMTNLLHVAELLHQAETEERLHLAGLIGWLERQRADDSGDADARQVRLDRDDAAATVMTIHKSKGLQFPVVFVPWLWSTMPPKRHHQPLIVPRPARRALRQVDLRAPEDRPDSFAAALQESRREDMRLLYVALTRPRHRCVVYTGHLKDFHTSPLAVALHGGTGSGDADRFEVGAKRGRGTRGALWSDLVALASGSATRLPDGRPTIAVSRCAIPDTPQWAPPADGPTTLAVRTFTRAGLDPTWRRHSYTALTRGHSAVYVGSAGEREGFDADEVTRHDEPGVHPWAPRHDVSPDAPDVPLASFPAGAAAGTCLHEIFEHADFTSVHPDAPPPEGPDSLGAVLPATLTRHGFDADRWGPMLLDGLTDVLRTPLGGVLGPTRLCDVATDQRFDELEFDYAVAGGNAFGQPGHTAPVTSEGLVAALRSRKELGTPSLDDERIVRAAWLAGLADLGTWSGFMTGSIDLVFRHVVDGHARWFVVDYKSNRLDPRRTGRTPIVHFSPEGMRFEMEQHLYYLQYHLYALALHRYLRSRLRDAYSYERDFGGVYYLFLRGMIGTDTPRAGDLRYGCFHDRPPAHVIDRLDRLFEGGDR